MEMIHQDKGSDWGMFVSGLALGALIGAGIALMLAPQSGQEMRNMIGEKSSDLKDQISNKAGEVQRTASDKVNQVSKQVSDRAHSMANQPA
jgi:gas vesicle protein